MTDLDLRKIAGELNYRLFGGQQPEEYYEIGDAQIAALLNAVVEERERVIGVRLWLDWVSGGKQGPSPSLMPDYRDQALRELNLEGVWPVKEK